MRRERSECASAELLWRTRKAAGLSQRDLAERAGTKQSSISRIENGRVSPTIHTLEQLVRACGSELLLVTRPSDESIRAALASRPMPMRLATQIGVER